MAERKTGAGHLLSGVLERSTPLRPVAPSGPDVEGDTEELETQASGPAEPAGTAKGRGGTRTDREPARKASAVSKTARKIKGHTIYLPDDLFERLLVQSHRRDKTISEYVVMILERQVPDHRTIRGDAADEVGAA